jgi:hypothetical protein
VHLLRRGFCRNKHLRRGFCRNKHKSIIIEGILTWIYSKQVVAEIIWIENIVEIKHKSIIIEGILTWICSKEVVAEIIWL